MKPYCLISVVVGLLLCSHGGHAQTYYLLSSVLGSGGTTQASSPSYVTNGTVGRSVSGQRAATGFSGSDGLWSEYNSLKAYSHQSFAVSYGWNLLSVGKITSDARPSVLFPSAVTRAFAYANGYTASDTLQAGSGYWLKFPAPQLIDLPGSWTQVETIHVAAGWNLIGTIGSPVTVGTETQIPAGNTTTRYFGFNGAYFGANVLATGLGYWVKCAADGLIILSNTGSNEARNVSPPGDEELALNTLTIAPQTTDKTAPAQTLFFAASVPAGRSAESFEMPPQAPSGLDVRFATNRYAEFLSDGKNAPKEVPIAIHGAVGPVTLSWKMNEPTGKVYVLVEKKGEKIAAQHRLTADGAITITEPEKKTISLKLEQIPAVFALAQNYPNPFNPSTTIRFSTPEDAHISLKVFDVIGREVASLLEADRKAGDQTVRWNAANYASGVYFCRLSALGRSTGTSFTDVKKMILLK